MADLEADNGTVEWGHGTRPGYFAQDHHEQLESADTTAERWLWDFCPGKDRGYVRGELGLMLFSGDAAEKPLSTLSGGEAARLVFARMQVEQPNVLVLDEPTNHLDLESIEALVAGLQNYDGTLILVSHDRWFVNQLATRVVEISRTGIRDYHGTYEEYVHDCGDDHLDTDNVVLKTKRNDKKARAGSGERGGTGPRASGALTAEKRAGNGRDGAGQGAAVRRENERAREDRLARITGEIEAAESAIATIDRAFASAGYFENTPGEQVKSTQAERARLQEIVDRLLEEWERLEQESEAIV
jgi:energy-coupling factor transporter ATP-binding protein EcfA2